MTRDRLGWLVSHPLRWSQRFNCASHALSSSFKADCGSEPEAKTSPCQVVLGVRLALLPTSRFTRPIHPQIQLQSRVTYHSGSYLSTGWVIGTAGFAKETIQAQVDARGQGRRMTNATRVAQEAVWQETLEKLLRTLSRTADELTAAGKSAGWKLALAAALKARTTATNRWLDTALLLGNLHEVSRKVAAWTRAPDAALSRKLDLTPNPTA